jgi:hypothetical protein
METVAPKPKPAWRIRQQEKRKEKYWSDPEYRQKALEYNKNRYLSDDAYRQKCRERARQQYKRTYVPKKTMKLAVNQASAQGEP